MKISDFIKFDYIKQGGQFGQVDDFLWGAAKASEGAVEEKSNRNFRIFERKKRKFRSNRAILKLI